MGTSAPTQSVPWIVRYLKRTVTMACGKTVWQRGYHDHIIRSEADYLRIWDYIDTNPPNGGKTVTTASPRGRPCRDALLLYSTPATGGRPHGAAPTMRPRPAPSSVATSGRATFPPRGRLTGHRKGRPYGGNRTVSVGSAKPGAPTEPHQRKFLQTQGPVARW